MLRNRRGATSLEFALVAIPTLIITYGIMEATWQMATAAALEHATLRASRFGVTGNNAPVTSLPDVPRCRSEAIPWLASATTNGFLRPERLSVTVNAFTSFGGAVGRNGGSRNAGSGGQVATYTLTYMQPYLVRGLLGSVIGGEGITFQSQLIVKNEPFENAPC